MSSCCAVPQPSTPEVCPLCGASGKRVNRATVEALVQPRLRAMVADAPYFFVDTPTCDVVYFTRDPVRHYFCKSDLTVRVGVKEVDDPIPVCYCFEKTERMVIEDVLAHGKSMIFEEITAHVKANECACEVKNPAGRCCLGNVTKAIQKAQRLAGKGSGVLTPQGQC